MSENMYSESERPEERDSRNKRDLRNDRMQIQQNDSEVRSVLAVDLGASSGRVMLARYDGIKLALREIHRFDNVPLEEDGGLYWDTDSLLTEIKTGIRIAADSIESINSSINIDSTDSVDNTGTGNSSDSTANTDNVDNTDRGNSSDNPIVMPILSIGVDTWGVDYGWIGHDGHLLRAPHHYRDTRMARHASELERRLPPSDQFLLTGNQPSTINTVYQLFADLEEEPELRGKAAHFLMMPDLFHYQLSGIMAAERTILSTGGLLAAGSGEPSALVLDRLSIPSGLFAPIIPAGTVLGELRSELQAELCCGPLRVVAGASHDTASAVAAVPYKRNLSQAAAVDALGLSAEGAADLSDADALSLSAVDAADLSAADALSLSAVDAADLSAADALSLSTVDAADLSTVDILGLAAMDAANLSAVDPPGLSAALRTDDGSAPAAAFISCGTWSIAGIETPQPVLTEAAFERGLTNEVCFGGGSRLLKNITGLWLLQECRRHWNAAGEALSHADLAALAEAAGPAAARIDPDDPRFAAPGNMPERIRQYCRDTGQPIPGSPGEIARVVLESLADAYGRAIDELQAISGRDISAVHLVGGGSRNRLLCRLTAERTGREVIAGPVEASAAGSALIQLAALGELDFACRAEIIERSFTLERYLPVGSSGL
ncbi:rhamnulokinase [Saccharibacillus kuerlensis]|uniref:Rhamnulokinase n=1 Tax=Saccharibacillus kuerlensis TaxID=459527 RepID=A0ABQ2L8C3_9BACL|nr:rhamnulokinase family protein [Saccharibacillus kuerlensis]GGO06744.1 hypothetical protein GCM10010969_34640 [Saccharibacillus kuerlensis]